jgi:hypothetical protein
MYRKYFILIATFIIFALPSLSYSALQLTTLDAYVNNKCYLDKKAVCACVIYQAVTSGYHSDDGMLALAMDDNNGSCYPLSKDCASGCAALNNASSFLWVAAIKNLSGRNLCTSSYKADMSWGRRINSSRVPGQAGSSGAVQKAIPLTRNWTR